MLVNLVLQLVSNYSTFHPFSYLIVTVIIHLAMIIPFQCATPIAASGQVNSPTSSNPPLITMQQMQQQAQNQGAQQPKTMARVQGSQPGIFEVILIFNLYLQLAPALPH